jgi:hypothetical protein
MKIVTVKEGSFPSEYLGISTHSGVALEASMLRGRGDDSLIEVELEWDDVVSRYRVERFNVESK